MKVMELAETSRRQPYANVSPYLEQPLRTLAQAELDRRLMQQQAETSKRRGPLSSIANGVLFRADKK